MPYSYREIRRYPGVHIAVPSIDDAAQASRFRKRTVDEPVLSYRVPISIWSVGERAKIHLTVADGGSVVDVRSESSWWTTLQDWGKNQKNAARFFEALERARSPRLNGHRVAFCESCGLLLNDDAPSKCPECGAFGTFGAAMGTTLGMKSRRALFVTAVLSLIFAALILIMHASGFASPGRTLSDDLWLLPKLSAAGFVLIFGLIVMDGRLKIPDR